MGTRRTPSKIWSFFAFLFLSFGVAAAGSFVTAGSVETWYPGLAKPGWTPPSYVFAPVWTVLYFCMAVSAWRVWTAGKAREITTPLALFLFQISLNLLWSVLFFGFRAPAAAAVEILVLLAAIVLTIRSFWRIDMFAGWLLVPYLLWVAFAASLNIAIAVLNL